MIEILKTGGALFINLYLDEKKAAGAPAADVRLKTVFVAAGNVLAPA